jgi:hypothetical protein
MLMDLSLALVVRCTINPASTVISYLKQFLITNNN